MSREATRPTTPGCQSSPGDDDRRALPLRAEAAERLRLGLFSSRRFDRLPFAVEAVELGRDPRRPRSIRGQQQPCAERGVADAAAGIDARPEQESQDDRRAAARPGRRHR